MNYKGYKELECYIQARVLRIYISGLTKKFPSHEKFKLTAQIIDSSRSVTRNIAEGYGRYTYTDTRNFFIIARGLLLKQWNIFPLLLMKSILLKRSLRKEKKNVNWFLNS